MLVVWDSSGMALPTKTHLLTLTYIARRGTTAEYYFTAQQSQPKLFHNSRGSTLPFALLPTELRHDYCRKGRRRVPPLDRFQHCFDDQIMHGYAVTQYILQSAAWHVKARAVEDHVFRIIRYILAVLAVRRLLMIVLEQVCSEAPVSSQYLRHVVIHFTMISVLPRFNFRDWSMSPSSLR